MRYYLDCEFDGFGGELISIALVSQNGRSLYIVLRETASEEWVQQNVLPILWSLPPADPWCLSIRTDDKRDAAMEIARFLGDGDPVIISDWPADIRYLCGLIEFPMGYMAAIKGLKFELRRVDAYPTTLPGAVQHNAWWDAMALRHLLEVGSSNEARDDTQPLQREEPQTPSPRRGIAGT